MAAKFETDVTIAQNRRAKFDYFIEDTVEAGIMLTGTEVKSLRANGASLNESYAGPKDGAIYLINVHIPEYQQAGAKMNHEPRRPRKLLLHKRDFLDLLFAIAQDVRFQHPIPERLGMLFLLRCCPFSLLVVTLAISKSTTDSW